MYNTHISHNITGLPRAARTVLTWGDVDSARPLRVFCGIWQQDITMLLLGLVSCELKPAWLGLVFQAHLTFISCVSTVKIVRAKKHITKPQQSAVKCIWF